MKNPNNDKEAAKKRLPKFRIPLPNQRPWRKDSRKAEDSREECRRFKASKKWDAFSPEPAEA